MKNKTLFIALFFCEAIPTYIITQYLYVDYIFSGFVVSILAISLLLAWSFADRYEKVLTKLGYLAMFTGIALSISYFMNNDSSVGILISGLSMIIGVNVALRTRRMLAYLLIFSFMLFLFASSIVYDEYSMLSIVLFTFSFFSVVISDYYNSRIYLKSDYKSKRSSSFFGTTIILMLVVSLFTGILYYLLPQPKAIHYGLLPFGGTKNYKGTAGENNKESPDYKEWATQLPKYTIDGAQSRDKTNNLTYSKKDVKIELNRKYSYSTEKKLKAKNKKAYYSSISIDKENNNLSKVLFEVKGKEARFLRGDVYDTFDGKKWKKRVTKIYTINSSNALSYFDGKEWQRRSRVFTKNYLSYEHYDSSKTDNYTVTIKGKLEGKPIIYMPLGMVSLQFPSDTFYEEISRVIYAPSQLEVDTYYTASVESESYYGYDAMTFKAVWYKKTYLKHNMNSKLLEFTKQIIKDENNPFEKAQAIVLFFKRHYTYQSIQINDSIHNQTVEEILLRTKRGNALQFNTALVMMLRSSGVYARIATGYAPSEYNTETKSYVVERKNKAIWSEIFIEGRGWIAIHAAEDIPLEGEISTEIYGIDESGLNTLVLISFALFLFVSAVVFLYYVRVHIWTYITMTRIKKYTHNNDIDFVVKSYKEVEKYYRHFNKGEKASYTLQEYEKYIKGIKPENSYLIEYLSFYCNQAIYRGELDVDFDKNRYLEVSLYLVNRPFKILSFDKYIKEKLYNTTLAQ